MAKPFFAALFCAFVASAPNAWAAADAACTGAARSRTDDARIQQAIAEARRQHMLFGGQTIERNGGVFRVGHHEAEWSRNAGEALPTWERVAEFWRALPESQQPSFITRAGRMGHAQVAAGVTGLGAAEAAAVRESLLRAALIDTPWSAAFISYLIKAAGFSADEFAFSDSHSDYVRAALAASAAEAQGRAPSHAFRACDVATTRPRAGDLLCATRASTAGTAKFAGLAAALAARSSGQGFPMHCDLVVRADEGGDAKLETIGGNVVNSVTLTRMTLNADKVLGGAYITGVAPCTREEQPCREHLGRRPWLVLLQFRN